MTKPILIVGASHAGVHVAAALRELGWQGPITLVGAEPRLPYHRPPLSKALLLGAADAIELRPDAFYRSKNINLMLGQRVEMVDVASELAVTTDGTELSFDRLVLATGARVRRLTVPGAQLQGVTYLRSLDDALLLRASLSSCCRAVVIGGGFIGLEAAAALVTSGLHVTLVEAAERLMTRAVSPVVSEWFAALHREAGVAVRCGVGVAAIEGCETVESVTLLDGTTLPADLVVVGIGVEPRTNLAEQLALEIDNGIVVDGQARTSRAAILAVGDVAVSPHPREPHVSVRLESVQNASDQAAVAAANLMGLDRTYDAVPWFWSDQFNAKLQMAGAPSRYDELVVRGSLSEGPFTVLAYHQGRLVGCECVNAAADFVAVRRALSVGATFPPSAAADVAVRLKTLL